MAKVLLIDDSMFTRRAIAQIAREAGCEVSEAGDGRAGLTKAREERPDVVILDLIMPAMSGLEVLEALQEERSDLPVIIVTADIQTQTRDECLAQGASAVLNKPPSAAELKAVLGKVLAESEMTL